MEHFAALVGIDWSDTKHDVCLVDLDTGQREQLIIKHTPEALDEWVTKLRTRFPSQKLAVSLEQGCVAKIIFKRESYSSAFRSGGDLEQAHHKLLLSLCITST